MSYRRYLWGFEDVNDTRRALLEPLLPILVYRTGEVSNTELLQLIYTPAHPLQYKQIKLNAMPNMETALSILDPERYSNILDLDIFESLQAYVRRIGELLRFERFLCDSLSLEDRCICVLLESYPVRVTQTGDINVLNLENLLIPVSMKKKIVTFCKFFVRRFPISSYCWFCGKVNPFKAFPENVGLLPEQYSNIESSENILSCIYVHRLNWNMKFQMSNETMGFHNNDNCFCDCDCKCNTCNMNLSCPVKGNFTLNYKKIPDIVLDDNRQ